MPVAGCRLPVRTHPGSAGSSSSLSSTYKSSQPVIIVTTLFTPPPPSGCCKQTEPVDRVQRASTDTTTRWRSRWGSGLGGGGSGRCSNRLSGFKNFNKQVEEMDPGDVLRPIRTSDLTPPRKNFTAHFLVHGGKVPRQQSHSEGSMSVISVENSSSQFQKTFAFTRKLFENDVMTMFGHQGRRGSLL